MHKFLRTRVKADTPAITDSVGHGYASTAMRDSMVYVDDILKNLTKEFPDYLQYVSWRRCTPKEDFHFRIKTGTGSNDIVDIAKATLYLVAFQFRYRRDDVDGTGKSEWVDLPEQFMWVPYCEDTGQFYLSHTRYFLVPSLADKVLSFELGNAGAQQDRIFVKLLRDRFYICKDNYRLFVDAAATVSDMESQIKIDDQGHVVTAAGIAREGKPEEYPVTWNYLHHRIRNARNANKSGKIKTCLMHYLLARYGFRETFHTYAGFVPIMGPSSYINRKNFPKEDYTLVRSMQIKPRGLAKNLIYTSTDICFAVPKEHATELMLTMLASFYYIIDWYTFYIKDEWFLGDPEGMASGRDTAIWRVLLGDLIFNTSIVEIVTTHTDDVNDHLNSVDEYVDNIYVEKFKGIGLNIQTLYQFFGIVIERFNTWLFDPKSRNNTLYDKQLSVMQEVMMPITRAFMGVNFKLKPASKEKLSEQQIIKLFETNLKPRSIHTINRTPSPPMTSISYSGDNKLMTVASTLMVHKAKGKKRGPSMTAAEKLHVGMCEVGCFIQLSRSNLTGSTRLNFHVMIDDQGNILRRPEIKDLLDHTQRVLTRE